ncbi:hypothetical protein [Streptomyces sp. NPDC002133]|uniref:hypothetical protein n=1 Tax=Streptomyces sp. NPDC002133 TaxID=3154409 RepID=UPI003332EBB6
MGTSTALLGSSAASSWEDPERVHRIGALADSGDIPALAGARLGAVWWPHEGTGVGGRLRAMPRVRRQALGEILVARRHAAEAVPDEQERALVLLALVADGFAQDAWCDAWASMLEHLAGRYYWTVTGDEAAHLARALLSAGRVLPPRVVGFLRRSAIEGLDSADALLGLLPDPVLSPEEPWADRILAELPELGPRWRLLIAHLRSASATPTRRWDRGTAALTDGMDADAVRRTATPWLALAAHGGSGPDGGYDPYNIGAVRGLAWLLSLLPPHPETVRVLGALVERPPVKTVVAGAGVRALARLHGAAGRGELERLSGLITHKVTLKQIGAALDAGRP